MRSSSTEKPSANNAGGPDVFIGPVSWEGNQSIRFLRAVERGPQFRAYMTGEDLRSSPIL